MSVFNNNNSASSVFTKTTSTQPASFARKTTNEERAPRKNFINIGIPVIIAEEQTFVNIPVALAVDDIMAAVEKEVAKIGASSPDKWVELQSAKAILGTQVAKIFEAMQQGQSVTQLEIDPNNPDFGLLANVVVQFHKSTDKATTDVNAVTNQQDIIAKLASFKR